MVTGGNTNVAQSATIEEEIEKMKKTLDAQMTQMKINALQLLPIGPSQVPTDLIKLDHQSIQQYVDEKHRDTVKFNFDVTQFQSESVIVKVRHLQGVWCRADTGPMLACSGYYLSSISLILSQIDGFVLN